MPLKALSLRPSKPNDTTPVNIKPVNPNHARRGRSSSCIHKSQKSTSTPATVRISEGSRDSQFIGGSVIIRKAFSCQRSVLLPLPVGEGWGEGYWSRASAVRPLTLSLSHKGRGNLVSNALGLPKGCHSCQGCL